MRRTRSPTPTSRIEARVRRAAGHKCRAEGQGPHLGRARGTRGLRHGSRGAAVPCADDQAW
eukprot:438225-Prymnesium_polylepis.1